MILSPSTGTVETIQMVPQALARAMVEPFANRVPNIKVWQREPEEPAFFNLMTYTL